MFDFIRNRIGRKKTDENYTVNFDSPAIAKAHNFPASIEAASPIEMLELDLKSAENLCKNYPDEIPEFARNLLAQDVPLILQVLAKREVQSRSRILR